MFVTKCVLILCAAVAATSFELDVNNVLFHLFTVGHEESEPLTLTLDSIAVSRFSLQRPTIITIHNHREGPAGNFNAFVIPALLQRADANVIAMDWFSGAENIYSVGLRNAPAAGDIAATFINLLINDLGYSSNLITIVGLGLGGHIAGIAGRKAANPIGHIIALDPSLHGWSHHPDKLSTNAATLVEVLHATAGITGYDRPLGHLDFYANGGIHQPGCGANSTCSHSFAYVFYAESLTTEVVNGPRFRGVECDDYEQALAADCNGARDVEFGGFSEKIGASGIYSFFTNLVAPFARD